MTIKTATTLLGYLQADKWIDAVLVLPPYKRSALELAKKVDKHYNTNFADDIEKVDILKIEGLFYSQKERLLFFIPNYYTNGTGMLKVLYRNLNEAESKRNYRF